MFRSRMQTDGWIELAEYRVQPYFNQLSPSGYNIYIKLSYLLLTVCIFSFGT